jgi:two-component system, NarL family, nitrate/nitrite response regulator NarL
MTAELGTGGPGSRFTRTGLVADKNGTATAIDRGEVRVVVLSEVLLYREGLATLLGQVSGLQVTELVRDPGEAAAVVREGDADVVVVDLAAGDIGSVQTLLAAAPEARVVVLSAPQRPADVIALAEAGVLGYVTHEQSIAELAATIEKVAADEMVCAPWIATLLVRRVQALAADRPGPVDRLTPREAGILELVAEGLSNREIAARLHIELTTVKNHVHNILEKLGARTRAEAVGLMGFLSAFFSFFSGGSV